MTADYPTDQVPATPEYVLEVLRDRHRLDFLDPLSLTFETMIWEWEDALAIDSWGWDGFGTAMNQWWGVAIPAQEWKVFEAKKPTIGDLCNLIASQAQRPVIRPWKHIAGDCLPAGAFLTMRSLLAETGIDAEEIAPSTPLAPYLHYRWDKVWERFSLLAPGIGPVPDRSKFMRIVLSCGLSFGLLSVLVGCLGANPLFRIVFVFGVVVLACTAMLHGATRFWKFTDTNIRTFRDLAYALAGQQQRRRIQPSP